MAQLFGRKLPADKRIGEAWELCDRAEAQCRVKGPDKTLHEMWCGPDREQIFGTRAPNTQRFPILIKVLDAQDKLSLQVHPPTAKAAAMNGEPKTELWYFLDTTEEALIFAGLRPGVDRNAFEMALAEKKVAECFHQLRTRPGEVMFLPSGRVHAIGAGNVILEIQQNSDTTYRVYDWDRVDAKTGKERELHVKESLECIDFDDIEPAFTQPHGESVIRCIYFNIDRAPFFDKEHRRLTIDPASFLYLFTAQGRFEIGGQEYGRGTSLLAGADTGELDIECLEEYGEVVMVSWPD